MSIPWPHSVTRSRSHRWNNTRSARDGWRALDRHRPLHGDRARAGHRGTQRRTERRAVPTVDPEDGVSVAVVGRGYDCRGITLAQRLGWFENAEPWLALFTAVNLVPALLLLGWRLEVWRDWRWQAVFGLASVGSLAWVRLTIIDVQMIDPALVVAFGLVTILSVQGFGFLLTGEIRMYKEMRSPSPDSIGKQNAMLGGVQGLFQLVLILDLVYLRYGGFPL